MGCNTKRAVANKKRKISKQEIKEIIKSEGGVLSG